MSDLSTREQIRGEAFRRVFDVMTNRCRHNGAWSQAWDACVDCHQLATDAVDALGDLLPTGIEWGVYLDGMGPPNPFRTASESTARSLLDSQDDHVVRKYTHDWIEVTE